MRRKRTAGAGAAESSSVDILITGCEVSLWLGEQFAADLSQVFPNLNIKTISANKLLGLFGQVCPPTPKSRGPAPAPRTAHNPLTTALSTLSPPRRNII